MAESVGICEAELSVEPVSPPDLVSVLFDDLSWDTAIPTSIHFLMFLIYNFY